MLKECSRGLVLVAIATILGSVTSDACSQPNDDVEAAVAIRKASDRAEIHAVGLSSAANSRFTGKNVTDWPKLITMLQERKSPPVKAVCGFLSQKAEKLVARDNILEDFTNLVPNRPAPQHVMDLKGEVVEGMNAILDRSDFPQSESLSDVKFSENAKRLIALKEKRTAWQTASLNWEALATIFPGAITELLVNFRTVRIQIRAEKDVILVLSGSNPCHWDVEVKPGSKVTGILLCGYFAQSVKVFENPVDAPVLYRAAHNQDGTRRDLAKGAKAFGAYQEKHEDWKNFVVGVKEVTGKGFDSFQGGNKPAPKDEPYIIPPKK